VATAAAPRLTGGIAASVLLHAGLLAAIFFSRSSAPAPAPTMIRVSMLAAAAAPTRSAGVVAAEPPKPETPKPPEPKPVTAAPKVAAPTPKAKAAPPKRATQTEAPKAKETQAAPDAPKAAGGKTGNRGTDVATIDTPGIEFDYPFYATNIVRQLMAYFGTFAGTLKAEVQFVIRRDGSVDPQSIRLVTSSGNYSFDQRALGAVEAAANARKFGALPGGFREDILPVTFWFSPQVIR
jgi:outer membrane biosynthesis protein TonB